MKLIPLTRGKFAQVDDDDYERLAQWKWRFGARGYAVRYEKRKLIFMHREIMKTPEGMETDHINANGDVGGLNNQKYNLRVCTQSQNRKNLHKYSNNKSGHKGVSWHKGNGKWVAKITINKRRVNICYSDDPVIAARAYDEKALELFGDFAKTNF